MNQSIYGKINGLVYSFVNENRCNHDIIIMSPKTREDFRNEFYGRLGANSFSESGEPLLFDTNGEDIVNSQKHNALWDARVIRECFKKIQIRD